MNENIANQDLEKELKGFLNPITPSNDFVEYLQNRLKSKAEVVVEYPNYMLSIIFIFSGFAFGIVVLWFLRKLYKIVIND